MEAFEGAGTGLSCTTHENMNGLNPLLRKETPWSSMLLSKNFGETRRDAEPPTALADVAEEAQWKQNGANNAVSMARWVQSVIPEAHVSLEPPKAATSATERDSGNSSSQTDQAVAPGLDERKRGRDADHAAPEGGGGFKHARKNSPFQRWSPGRRPPPRRPKPALEQASSAPPLRSLPDPIALRIREPEAPLASPPQLPAVAGASRKPEAFSVKAEPDGDNRVYFHDTGGRVTQGLAQQLACQQYAVAVERRNSSALSVSGPVVTAAAANLSRKTTSHGLHLPIQQGYVISPPPQPSPGAEGALHSVSQLQRLIFQQQQQQQRHNRHLAGGEGVLPGVPALASGGSNRSGGTRCHCKRTKCLKLYCPCFAGGQFCGPKCNCHDCYNDVQFTNMVDKARAKAKQKTPDAFQPKVREAKSVRIYQASHGQDFAGLAQSQLYASKPLMQHARGCKCVKTKCLKRYCECFAAGVLCGTKCSCSNCENNEESVKRQSLDQGAGL